MMTRSTLSSLAVSSLVAAAVIGGAGCEKPAPAPQQTAAPKAAPTPAPATDAKAPGATDAGESGAAIDAGGVLITPPAGWKEMPPSNQMRLAELVVADASGDVAKQCVAAISMAGGDVESNVSRWAGQFKDASGAAPKAEVHSSEVNGLKVHTVELVGTYQGMSDKAPMTDWMMRGAIVESAGGQSVFIKMTGPAEGMKKLTDGWNSLVAGLKRK